MESQSSEENAKRLHAARKAATEAFYASLFKSSLQALIAPAVEMVEQSILARVKQQQHPARQPEKPNEKPS